jgi:hypothetical protein
MIHVKLEELNFKKEVSIIVFLLLIKPVLCILIIHMFIFKWNIIGIEFKMMELIVNSYISINGIVKFRKFKVLLLGIHG